MPPLATENVLPIYPDADFSFDFGWEGLSEWPSQNDEQSSNQGEAVQPAEEDLSTIIDSILSSVGLLDEQAAAGDTPVADANACVTSDVLFGLQEAVTTEVSWIPSPDPAQESEKRVGKRRIIDDEPLIREPSPVLKWSEETPLLERSDDELFRLTKACEGNSLQGIALDEEPQAFVERPSYPGQHTPEPPAALDDTPAVDPPVPKVKQSRNQKSSNKRKLDAAGFSTAHSAASKKHIGGFDERLRLDPRTPQDRPEVIDPKNRTTIRRHKRDVFINSVEIQGSYTVPKGKSKGRSKKPSKAPAQPAAATLISSPSVPPIRQQPSSRMPPAPAIFSLARPAASPHQVREVPSLQDDCSRGQGRAHGWTPGRNAEEALAPSAAWLATYPQRPLPIRTMASAPQWQRQERQEFIVMEQQRLEQLQRQRLMEWEFNRRQEQLHQRQHWQAYQATLAAGAQSTYTHERAQALYSDQELCFANATSTSPIQPSASTARDSAQNGADGGQDDDNDDMYA
ncbi:hypothetical protein NLJ89_g9369 [Agrocybe chaxingu]|uniref:Uncharacterized protein n=1 Tax=Agrocybe chaxingu TaxID=84603 RepID=A0A9W8MT66_9AGAR|nr:hypothetical protein NLJ89_g9369 [Agrocybe chaxingu]